jgi:hypothetical protein
MEIFSEKVGANWGESAFTAGNVSAPFATFTIAKEYLALKILWMREFRFEREDIQGLNTERRLWSKGIRIRHTKHEYPSYIRVIPQNPDRMKDSLAQFGYAVTQ